MGRSSRALLGGIIGIVLALAGPIGASALAGLTKLSSDPYTNTTSQHQTQVEPDTFSVGSTIVSAFQSGRFFDGGASNIGWATTLDAGATWTHGFLPGITKIQNPSNPFDRVSDPAVAYDAKHKMWLIESLGITTTAGPVGAAVLASRSSNGKTWANPVTVYSKTKPQFLDKPWIACDNTPASSFYGHCYVEFDNANGGDLVYMSTSSDGGATWGTAKPTSNNGLGGQPVVQPNGTVVVPYESFSGISAFASTNGGLTWGAPVVISSVVGHNEGGNLRSSPLPSAEIDGSGKVYVAWQDCRFESGCSANDIVFSSSPNGVTWSPVKRIPIDAVGSGVDHFIPGLAVDVTTSGATAHLELTYYYYSASNCTTSTCRLLVGFVSSTDGGSTWSAPITLAGPMKLTWLPNTSLGYMVGDYISTSIAISSALGHVGHGVFAVATAPVGAQFREAMYTNSTGRATSATTRPVTDDAVLSTQSNEAFRLPTTAY